MQRNLCVRAALLCASLLTVHTTWAVMPSHPDRDSEFTRLPDGRKLTDIKVRGASLTLTKGYGRSFGSSQQAAYQQLKSATQSDPRHAVQWAMMDLDSHRVVAQSLDATRPVFGASVTKVFTGSTLLHKMGERLSASQMQELADMLVVSDNGAWVDLQVDIGDGSHDRGRGVINAFTQGMGYQRTRGYSGYWGGRIHGNELTALELVEFMHDTYKGSYVGAETLWKVMHTVRTGSAKGDRYLPKDVYVGGKTGTYDGETENPETGRTQNPDGSAYRVRVRNHLLTFSAGGRQYALAVLANDGSNETAALLAGGLYREYAAVNGQ